MAFWPYLFNQNFGGGGGQLPDILTDLAFWLDASDEATITHTAGDVTAVTDKSGNGFHLSLKSGSPRYGDVLQNGLKTLTFANGDALQNTPIDNGDLINENMSVYAVFRQPGGATYDAAPVVLSASNQGRPFDKYEARWHQNASVILNGRTQGTDPYYFTDMSWHLYKDDVAAGQHRAQEYYRNGLVAETISTQTWNVGTINLGVGQRQDSATQFIGDIAEIRIYRVKHDNATREAITLFLQQKWADTFEAAPDGAFFWGRAQSDGTFFNIAGSGTPIAGVYNAQGYDASTLFGKPSINYTGLTSGLTIGSSLPKMVAGIMAIRPTGTLGNYYNLFTKDHGAAAPASNRDWNFYIHTSGNLGFYRVQPTTIDLQSSVAVDFNQNQTVGFWSDGSQVHIYKNGVLSESLAIGTLENDFGQVFLGFYAGAAGTGSIFKGLMGEVLAFDTADANTIPNAHTFITS